MYHIVAAVRISIPAILTQLQGSWPGPYQHKKNNQTAKVLTLDSITFFMAFDNLIIISTVKVPNAPQHAYAITRLVNLSLCKVSKMASPLFSKTPEELISVETGI